MLLVMAYAQWRDEKEEYGGIPSLSRELRIAMGAGTEFLRYSEKRAGHLY